MANALQTIDVPELDLSAYNDMPPGIQVSLSGSGLDVGSMFKVPRFSGDGLIGASPPRWVCKATNPPISHDVLTGTIVSYKQFRAFYAGEYSGGATAPTCASIDMENGLASFKAAREHGVGGKCFECPFNYFGRGSCGNRLALFMLAEEVEEPIVLDLPPTSVKPVADNLRDMERVVPVISAFKVKAEFEQHTTKSGQHMWRASIQPLEVHDQNGVNNIASLTKKFADLFELVPNVSDGEASAARESQASVPQSNTRQQVAGEVIDSIDVSQSSPVSSPAPVLEEAAIDWDD